VRQLRGSFLGRCAAFVTAATTGEREHDGKRSDEEYVQKVTKLPLAGGGPRDRVR
jgi:hypothetical protein